MSVKHCSFKLSLQIILKKKSTNLSDPPFLKDHVTLKKGRLLKIQLCVTGINYFLYLKIYSYRKYLTTLLHLMYFWSYKCSRGDQKRSSDPKHLNRKCSNNRLNKCPWFHCVVKSLTHYFNVIKWDFHHLWNDFSVDNAIFQGKILNQ